MDRTEEALGEVDTSFGSALANSLDQPLEGLGITLEALGAEEAGRYLRDLMETPENYQSASAEFMNEDGRFYDFSYLPRAVVEQTGQFAGSVLSRGAGALIGGAIGAAGGSVVPGVGSAAGGATGAAAGALLGPALFEGMQILGPVALQRAENNGRNKPNAEDWSVAFATASASGAMNSIAPGAQGILRRALLEGGTEAVQAIIQQSGETALTDVGLDVNLKEAVGEGILGAGSAGLVDTTTTAVDRAISSDVGQAFIQEESGSIKLPGYRVDNPGGDWLANAVARAEQKMAESHEGLSGKGLSGSTTAYTQKSVQLPVGLLKNLRGALNEKPAPGNGKWDAIQEEFNEVGWRQDKPILIGVNHKGQAFIMEGNNRVAVAASNGVDKIPAIIQWYNGAEEARGPFNPANIAKMTQTKGPSQDGSSVKPKPVSRFMPKGAVNPLSDFTLKNPEVFDAVKVRLNEQWNQREAEADKYPSLARAGAQQKEFFQILQENPEAMEDFLSQIPIPQDGKDRMSLSLSWDERHNIAKGFLQRHSQLFDPTVHQNEYGIMDLMQTIHANLAQLLHAKEKVQVTYRPRVPELLDSFEWPKSGLTGAQFLKILADSPSVRQSEVRSFELDIDPQARYSKDDITQMLSDKLWEVTATKSNRWNSIQRQKENADTEVDYFAYNIDATRKGKIFQPVYGVTHFNPNTLAHVRASVRSRPDGTRYILIEELQSDLLQAGYKPATDKPISVEDARQSFLETHQPLVDNLEALGAENDVNMTDIQREMLPFSVEFIKGLSPESLEALAKMRPRTLEYYVGEELKKAGFAERIYAQDGPYSPRMDTLIKFGAKHITSIRNQVTDVPLSEPPVTKTEETVRLALDAAIYEAAQQGIKEIRIPSLERLLERRYDPGTTKYEAALDPKSGFYATYKIALEKVLREYEQDLGAKVYDAPLRYFDTDKSFEVADVREVITPELVEWPADEESFRNYLLDNVLQDILAVNTDGRGETSIHDLATGMVTRVNGLHPPIDDVGNWNGPLDVEEVGSVEEVLSVHFPQVLEALYAGEVKSLREYMEIEHPTQEQDLSRVLDLSGVDFDKVDVSRPGFAEGGLVDRTRQAFGMAEGGAVMTSLRPQPRPVGSEEVIRPKPNPRAEQFALDRQRQSAYNMANDEYRQDLQPYTENNPFAQLGLDPSKHRHISHENKNGSLAAWHFGEAMPKPAVDSYLGRYGVQDTQGAKGGEIVTARNSARPGVLAHEYSHRGFGMVEDEFARDPEGFRNRYGAETADFVDMIWSVLAVQHLEPQVVGQMLSPERVQAVLSFLKANPELSNPEEWVVELFDHSHEEGMAEARQYASPLDQLAFQLGQAGGAKPEEWKMKAADGLVRAANDLLQKGAMQ